MLVHTNQTVCQGRLCGPNSCALPSQSANFDRHRFNPEAFFSPPTRRVVFDPETVGNLSTLSFPCYGYASLTSFLMHASGELLRVGTLGFWVCAVTPVGVPAGITCAPAGIDDMKISTLRQLA